MKLCRHGPSSERWEASGCPLRLWQGWLTLSLRTQCICQLVGALARSDCRGINVQSQLENITDILFTQVSSVRLAVSLACSCSFLWRR